MCPLPLHYLKLRDKSNTRLAATLETRLNRVRVSRRIAALLLLLCFPAAGAHSQHHDSARRGQPIMTQHKTSGRWGTKGGRWAAAVTERY